MRTRTFKALLAACAAACCAAAAQAAPSMIVLSSAAYDSGALDDRASALAIDAAGNVFVTGTSGSDFLSQKYSKGLVISPTAQALYANGRSSNRSNSIALDGLGNIIVAGEEMNAASNLDFLVLKYSANFAALVSSAVHDGGTYDSGAAVRTDSQNNILVTGYSDDSGNKNIYTIKYSPALVRLSTVSYDGTGGAIDQATAIAVDASDNALVAGYTQGATYNSVLLKYDGGLNLLAEKVFDSGGDDRAVAVAVDSAGNVIVAVRQTTNTILLKYDGALSALVSSAAFSGITPAGLAVDDNDQVLVSGYTGTAGTADFYTFRCDGALQVISTAAYVGAFSDQAAAAAVDYEDNVVVTGQTNNGATVDYFTVKYNAAPRLTDVTALYIGETSNVTLTGRGLLADTAVAFADASISTGASSFNSGQITVAVTPAASVILGVTTITVTNSNSESASDFTLARTRLRQTILAGQAADITAMTRLGQVSLSVLSGSFPLQETITLSPEAPALGDIQQVGEALFVAGAPSTSSLVNLGITLRYRTQDLGGYPESALSIGYYDSAAGWVTLTSSVNTAAKTVTAYAKAANNKYGVIKAVSSGGGGGGIGGPGGGSGIPAKVYPNPYKPGSGGNFDQSALGDGIVFGGLNANESVSITIVDMAGQLVFQKSGTADASGRYFWDTSTASGGKAATGVYVYFLKGGGEPRKGKFSIIR